jgi:hypothetical protein
VNANGAAIDLSQRATTINGTPNSPVLTDDEAAVIGDMTNTFGDWQPTLTTEQAPVPANVTLKGSTLSWDNSDYALLWAICKDGCVVAFTTSPTYDVTEPGAYTVRAANEAGGLSKESESVVVINELPTGVKEVRGKVENTKSGVYDLLGRNVNRQIKKGLFVLDGHKVVVK